MKTKFKILIIFVGVSALVFLYHEVYQQILHYETWGNNEHWYFHPAGHKVECEVRLFQSPGNCVAIDENGNIVDTKTELGNWRNAK